MAFRPEYLLALDRISVITAALVYLALAGLLVRPMMRITRNMVAYRENPEDTSRIIPPSGRYDEIGVAENELATLQSQLSGLLREKARLANSASPSRRSITTCETFFQAHSLSPTGSRRFRSNRSAFLPQLIRALDRAIILCTNTMKYGRSEERLLIEPEWPCALFSPR